MNLSRIVQWLLFWAAILWLSLGYTRRDLFAVLLGIALLLAAILYAIWERQP